MGGQCLGKLTLSFVSFSLFSSLFFPPFPCFFSYCNSFVENCHTLTASTPLCTYVQKGLRGSGKKSIDKCSFFLNRKDKSNRLASYKQPPCSWWYLSYHWGCSFFAFGCTSWEQYCIMRKCCCFEQLNLNKKNILFWRILILNGKSCQRKTQLIHILKLAFRNGAIASV